MKTCTKCNQKKEATVENFYKNPRGKDGLQSRCKDCQKKQVAEKWKNNPEYFNEYAAKKRAKDPIAENKRVNESRLKTKKNGVACVYTITNKKTGRIYVGETIWRHRRWTQHKHNLSNGSHENSLMQEDCNKFGIDSFIFDTFVVVEDKNKATLLAEEKSLISRFSLEGKKMYNKNLTNNLE